MDATAWIAIMGIIIGSAALVVARLNRREDAGDEHPHGDSPHLPSDMIRNSHYRGNKL